MKIIIICLTMLMVSISLAQEDPFKKLDEKFDSMLEDMNRSHQDYLARQDATWKAYVNRIEAKWNKFEESTKKKWVNYSNDLDAKSRVEFEKGFTEIEAIQEADNPEAQKIAEEKMKAQLKKMFTTDNDAGTNVLENQVAFDDSEKRMVNQNNADEYFEEKIRKNISKVEIFKSKDGKKRIRYRVKVPFVKNHIVRRAQKFLPTVVKNAARFDLEPRLILAIIYTESAFNPLAKSWADAHGLMQLIPRYGARDAYRFLYNQDKMVSPAYLYNPDKNIELGCAYLHVLFNSNWKKETNPEKRRDLSICSYNWGPHNVDKKIYKRYNGKSLSYRKLYSLLRRYSPDETSKYLEKVLSRQSYFDVFFKN